MQVTWSRSRQPGRISCRWPATTTWCRGLPWSWSRTVTPGWCVGARHTTTCWLPKSASGRMADAKDVPIRVAHVHLAHSPGLVGGRVDNVHAVLPARTRDLVDVVDEH